VCPRFSGPVQVKLGLGRSSAEDHRTAMAVKVSADERNARKAGAVCQVGVEWQAAHFPIGVDSYSYLRGKKTGRQARGPPKQASCRVADG
jgi:hypothetical protein